MNILITGASRGLGLALARAFAQRGDSLIIDARGAEALQAVAQELATQTTVYALPGDISDLAHQTALREAAEQLGEIDVLINNAGILGPSPQPYLLDYPAVELARVFQINVLAQIGLIQTLAPQLKSDVQILNISSDAAVGAYPGWGGYGAAKAALDHLTAILAAEQPTWQVYAVDPGDMYTQMHQEAFPGEDISDRPAPEASVPGILHIIDQRLPSGRYIAKDVLTPKPIKGLRIALNVQDFPAAVRLYRDGVGLTQIDQWDNNGHGIVLDAGQVELEIIDQQHTRFVDEVEVGHAVSGSVRLAWRVDDLHSAAERFFDYGATQVNDPVHTPWNDEVMRLAGPDGQQITLYVTENGGEA